MNEQQRQLAEEWVPWELDIRLPAGILPVLDAIEARGWTPLVVGGAVRDAALGNEPKDLDIEVYGCTSDELLELARPFGRADIVGAKFGTLKLTIDGNEYDLTLPRRDNKVGRKHTDFEVELDPDITLTEATSRRDFTVNSMMYYVPRNGGPGRLYDMHGGMQDLQDRVLRHTSEAFKEDPIRVLRGMQILARMPKLQVHPETAKMIREELSDPEEYASQTLDRIAIEWWKLFSKGVEPGRVLDYLREVGWLKFYPELECLTGIPQDPIYHPEGWRHSAAEGDESVLWQESDSTLPHSQDVGISRDPKIKGGRFVARPYDRLPDMHVGAPELYVTVDIPHPFYTTYVFSHDRVTSAPLVEPALRHLADAYGLHMDLHKVPPFKYAWGYHHAENLDNGTVRVTVGYCSPLSALLLKLGCPSHVYVVMGDVVEHVRQSMNMAAYLATADGLNEVDRAKQVFTAMVHDLGKAGFTDMKPKITSHGHEAGGVPYVEALAERVGFPKKLLPGVCALVKHHMAYMKFSLSPSGVRQLAHALLPATFEDWGRIVEIDHAARFPLPPSMPAKASAFMVLAEKEGLLKGFPVVMRGRDVVALCPACTGPKVGEVIRLAVKAYLAGELNLGEHEEWFRNRIDDRHGERKSVELLSSGDLMEAGVTPGPEFGQLLDDAWRAQTAVPPEFSDRSGALAWLQSRLSNA